MSGFTTDIPFFGENEKYLVKFTDKSTNRIALIINCHPLSPYHIILYFSPRLIEFFIYYIVSNLRNWTLVDNKTTTATCYPYIYIIVAATHHPNIHKSIPPVPLTFTLIITLVFNSIPFQSAYSNLRTSGEFFDIFISRIIVDILLIFILDYCGSCCKIFSA